MAYPLHIFDLGQAPPGKMTWPTVVGGTVTGGTSLSGVSSTVGMAGSGYVAIKYSTINVTNSTRARLLYMSRLGVMLNGGVRPILVPLLTDFTAPVPLGGGAFSASEFSDATQFTDGTAFVSNPVNATLAADAAVNAATLQVAIYSNVSLQGGEWFSIHHPTKSHRAYCITDVDAAVADSGLVTYTLAIRPTLREAVQAGDAVTFDRPLCIMALPQDSPISVDVDVGYLATPDISFQEYFGVRP